MLIARNGGTLPPTELPGPPPLAWGLRNIAELRVCSCPALTAVPPEIGLCTGLKSLVFISNSLISFPEEVWHCWELEQVFLNGNFLRKLPKAIGRLPKLKELCVDANLLEAIPPMTSQCFELLSAPANYLTELPFIAGKPKRIETNGNKITSVAFSRRETYWNELITLKLMGNQLTELPPEVELFRRLRVINISANRVSCIPDFGTITPELEWVFLYSNLLRTAPIGIFKNEWIQRILIEDNPLSADSTLAFVCEVVRVTARAECRLTTVGLDTDQLSRALESSPTESGSLRKEEALPVVVSVGDMIQCDGDGQYFMKITRASQLRRCAGVRAIGQDGIEPVLDKPLSLLVVAFAASQGEPEWQGLLRRLFDLGKVTAQAAPVGDFDAKFAKCDQDAIIRELWKHCTEASNVTKPDQPDSSSMALPDFDVLSVVDHRMRWFTCNFVEAKFDHIVHHL